MLRLNLNPILACSALFSVLSLLLASGCGSDDESSGNDFNRRQMLEHYADNLILPHANDLAAKTATLDQSVIALADAPNQTNLDAAQNAWTEAYKAWQFCGAYNFGPGQRTRGTIAELVATFPADAALIDQYIAAEDYSLDNFNRDTRGFLAVEYLLWSDPSPAALEPGEPRLQYLRAVSQNLAETVQSFASEWIDYRTTFVENDGIDAGSSTSMLFNEWNKHYEVLKNFKIGLPSGARAGQTEPDPTLVECRYSGQSLEMAGLHFLSVENHWRGTTRSATDGPGFSDYLSATDGGPELVADTETQLVAAQEAFGNIPGDQTLQQTITENPDVVKTAFQELQKLTRFFKSEAASLLGISITYDSGDGD